MANAVVPSHESQHFWPLRLGESLDLAERAGRISMSPSLRMFLAEQQNALIRFVLADMFERLGVGVLDWLS